MQENCNSRYRWVILAVATVVYATSSGGRFVYSTVAKYLEADLGFGKPEIGLIGSAFFYTYALGQILSGVFTDRFGGRIIVSSGIIFLGAAILFFANASQFEHLILLQCVMGLGAAAGYVPVTAVLSRWFSAKEKGFALSVSGFLSSKGSNVDAMEDFSRIWLMEAAFCLVGVVACVPTARYEHMRLKNPG